MAKLSDLVNVNINQDTIFIQGVEIPVVFTMRSFPYVEEAYGKPYHIFEKDLNRMMKQETFRLGKEEANLMIALIYAMIRSGGTEATIKEVENSIPLHDLPGVFETAIRIFQNQIFQKSDMDQLKTEKKSEV